MPIFGPKQPKNHTLWGGTYLYGIYKGVTPPPTSGYNKAFNLEFVHLLQLSVMRNSTWLGLCLIMTFPMKATFHASLVLWNILLMEASYAGYISFCHQVSCCYCCFYYYYYYLIKHRVFPRSPVIIKVIIFHFLICTTLLFFI